MSLRARAQRISSASELQIPGNTASVSAPWMNFQNILRTIVVLRLSYNLGAGERNEKNKKRPFSLNSGWFLSLGAGTQQISSASALLMPGNTAAFLAPWRNFQTILRTIVVLHLSYNLGAVFI